METQKNVLLTLVGMGMFLFVFSVQLVTGRPSAGGALAQSDRSARVLWETELPQELQARLYELAVVPGTARVLATSPTAVWLADENGKLSPVLNLRSDGSRGESAILAPDGSRIGILVHDHHGLAGFRLLTPEGEVLAQVDSATQFHYRIAPGGKGFVGIDAGSEHVPAKAEKFAYTFYDESGKEIATVESPNPVMPDSAYTADGAGFLVNNARGVTLYDATSGERLWQIEQPARKLAAGTIDSAHLLADSGERDQVHAVQDGKLLWSLALGGPARNVAVAPQGGFLVATDRQTAHLLTPDSDRPLFSFTLPDESLAINDVAVSDAGVVALGAQEEGVKSGVILVLDAAGKVMAQQEVSYEFSSAWVPGVRFDRTGRLLLAWTLEQLFLVTGE